MGGYSVPVQTVSHIINLSGGLSSDLPLLSCGHEWRAGNADFQPTLLLHSDPNLSPQPAPSQTSGDLRGCGACGLHMPAVPSRQAPIPAPSGPFTSFTSSLKPHITPVSTCQMLVSCDHRVGVRAQGGYATLSVPLLYMSLRCRCLVWCPLCRGQTNASYSTCYELRSLHLSGLQQQQSRG